MACACGASRLSGSRVIVSLRPIMHACHWSYRLSLASIADARPDRCSVIRVRPGLRGASIAVLACVSADRWTSALLYHRAMRATADGSLRGWRKLLRPARGGQPPALRMAMWAGRRNSWWPHPQATRRKSRQRSATSTWLRPSTDLGTTAWISLAAHRPGTSRCAASVPLPSAHRFRKAGRFGRWRAARPEMGEDGVQRVRNCLGAAVNGGAPPPARKDAMIGQIGKGVIL